VAYIEAKMNLRRVKSPERSRRLGSSFLQIHTIFWK